MKWMLFIFLWVLFVVIVVQLNEKRKVLESQKTETMKKQNIQNTYGVPIDKIQTSKYFKGLKDIPENSTINVWIKDNMLNLMRDGETTISHQIQLENINFYTIKGDVKQELETKGGNQSVAGTMITEGLFGTAAAMKKNQPTQNLKTIDERKTIINATIDGKDTFIFFEGADLYNYLLENIPEKEQSFIAIQK